MKRAITQIFTLLLLITLAVPAFAGKVLAEIEYFYSDAGTLIGKAFNGTRVNFEYDLRGQLLAVKDASGKDLERYTYDPAGNRLSKTINGVTTTYTYDKANQLVTSTVNGKTTHYKYDAAGRMIQAGDKKYIYNGQNKVSEVRQNGKTIARFEYNIDGQIAKAIYGDKVEEFMWDGLALIWRSGVTYINEPYVTGGNPVMAGDNVLFNDMLGSTLAVNGKPVEMTAFGETTDADAFFTGKPMIPELGYSFLFRDYNPAQGKWTTTDPIGYPDGWNNLAYVNNGVTWKFDWVGMCEQVPVMATVEDPNNPGYTIQVPTGETYTVRCSPGVMSVVSVEYTDWSFVGDISTAECGNHSSLSLHGMSASISWSGAISYFGIAIAGSYSGISTTNGYSNIPPYDCPLETGDVHQEHGFIEYRLKYRLKLEVMKKTYDCGEVDYSLQVTPAWSYGVVRSVTCVKE